MAEKTSRSEQSVMIGKDEMRKLIKKERRRVSCPLPKSMTPFQMICNLLSR